MLTASFLWLAIAAPAQVEITGKATKISQGNVTITLLADGSVRVISPTVNLVIPADQVAPEPAVDDFADTVKAIYGADQDGLKKAKLSALIKSYESALQSIDKAQNVSDLAASLTKFQTLKPDDLRPLRDRIAKEIQTTLGTDPEAPLDIPSAKALLQKIISTLKGI